MMQRVLITGASGFIGYHLIEQCILKGLEVFVAVRKSSDVKHLSSFKLQFTYPLFDNVEALTNDLREHQFDFVIHAAGTTKALNAADYNKVNATYTANLAKAVVANSNSIKKLVFISSLGAIGPLFKYDQLITADTPPAPVTAYGRSKLLAETTLAGITVPTVILRPTAVYGPREKDIFIILKTIAQGYEPYIGKVQQQLSFIYVKDLAVLTVNALFSANTGAYNLTDGNCYNRYQLADITKAFFKRKTFKFHLPHGVVSGLAVLLERGYGFLNKTSVLNKEKLNELTALNWCCDISKATNELDFLPKYNLQNGLIETLAWYKQNQWM